MADPTVMAQMAGVSAFIAAMGGIRLARGVGVPQREATDEEKEFLTAFARNALMGKRFFVGLAKAGAVVGGIVSAVIAVWHLVHNQ
tara:strand:+ start:356 stop:613 length:258 start_codon:yes stop_codon:yes gene_type:complete